MESIWTERQDIGPAPRSGHAMAFDTNRSRVVLFSGAFADVGNDPSVLLGDTWEHQE